MYAHVNVLYIYWQISDDCVRPGVRQQRSKVYSGLWHMDICTLYSYVGERICMCVCVCGVSYVSVPCVIYRKNPISCACGVWKYPYVVFPDKFSGSGCGEGWMEAERGWRGWVGGFSWWVGVWWMLVGGSDGYKGPPSLRGRWEENMENYCLRYWLAGSTVY